MRVRVKGWNFAALLAAGLVASALAADDAATKRDLFTVITLNGMPCGEVVSVASRAENDHVATCKDGNRYRVFLNAEAAWSSRNSRETRMFFGYNGLWGLLILAGDIWAIINIFQSSVSNEKKLLWTLVVLLLPVLGLILWFVLGPRDRKP